MEESNKCRKHALPMHPTLCTNDQSDMLIHASALKWKKVGGKQMRNRDNHSSSVKTLGNNKKIVITIWITTIRMSASNFPFGLGFLLATFFFVLGTLFGRKKVALLNPGKITNACNHMCWILPSTIQPVPKKAMPEQKKIS